jgi:hypothetical protein
MWQPRGADVTNEPGGEMPPELLMPDGDVLLSWYQAWSTAWLSQAEDCPVFVDESHAVALELFRLLQRIEGTISVLEPGVYRAGLSDFFQTFTCVAVWSLEVSDGRERGVLRLQEAHLLQSFGNDDPDEDIGSKLVTAEAEIWLYCEVAGRFGEETKFFSRSRASVFGDGDSDLQEARGTVNEGLKELFARPAADDRHDSTDAIAALVQIGDALLDSLKGRVRDPVQTYPALVRGFKNHAIDQLRVGTGVGPATAADDSDAVTNLADDSLVAEALHDACRKVHQLEEVLLALELQPTDQESYVSAVSAWRNLRWNTSRRRGVESSEPTKVQFTQRMPRRIKNRGEERAGLLTFRGAIVAEGSCRAYQPLWEPEDYVIFESIGQPDPAVFGFSLEVNLDEEGTALVTVWEPERFPKNERGVGALLGSSQLLLPAVSRVLRRRLNEIIAMASIEMDAFDLSTQALLLLNQAEQSSDLSIFSEMSPRWVPF